MSPKTLLGVILASAGAAAAQPGVQRPASPPIVAPQQPQATPPYESLVKRDAQNKVIRIDGCLEALAFQRNPLIDDGARERAKAAIQEWTADVNQLAIDNLDFIEKIDAGLIQTADPMDVQRMKMLQSVSSQLSSAGSLSMRLNQRQAIESRPMQLCMQMANEYIQAIAMELSTPTTTIPPTDTAALQ